MGQGAVFVTCDREDRNIQVFKDIKKAQAGWVFDRDRSRPAVHANVTELMDALYPPSVARNALASSGQSRRTRRGLELRDYSHAIVAV